MKCWAAVIALAGCDHVFQLDTVRTQTDAAPLADAAPDAATFSCPTPLLEDDFTGSTPCAPWGQFTSGGNATAMEGSGALTFQVPPGAEGRCTTVANIPLPSGGFAVSFLLVPSGQNSYITLESMKLAVELTVQAGRLLFQVNGGGVMPYASVQYDPLAMRYLRLTPDASTHAITAAYSKDAVTWTDLSGTAPLTTAPASVDILIKAGELVAGEASAAKFAHLIACP